MISFSQHLEEGRDAPLYHGLSTYGFKYMVEENVLRGRSTKIEVTGWEEYPRKHYLSFTRNAKFAFEWAEMRDGIVLEFDQRRLTQRYRLHPYSYFAFDMTGTRLPQRLPYVFYNQYEEHTDQVIKNPMQFVTRLLIPKALGPIVLMSYFKPYRDIMYYVDPNELKGTDINRAKSLVKVFPEVH